MGRYDFLVGDLGLERQKNRLPASFTGQVSGYYTVVEISEGQYTDNSFSIQLGMHPIEDSVEAIELLKDEIAAEHKVTILEGTPYVFAVNGSVPLRKKNLKDKVEGIIRTVTDRLEALGIPTGDFLNGDRDESVALYQMGNSYAFLSERSYQDVVEDMEELNQENGNAKPKSIEAGIGGAIVGALIGSVVWGVLLYFGFYAWAAGILGVYLAFYFYQKNNGLVSIPGMIIVTSIVVVMLIVANVLAYAFMLYQGLSMYGFTLSMVFLNFIVILQDLDLMSSFMVDLVLGIGVAALFAAAYAYRLYQSAKNVDKIERI